MKNKIKYLLLLVLVIPFLSGCSLLKDDEMEDISIITTIYPLEYVTKYLYGENALVNSVYPDDVNVDTYEFTEKQIKDYSKKDLYIYVGETKDSDLALKFVSNKKHTMKLINATYGMKHKYEIEEFWLNPSNLLMMSANIKNDLKDYIESAYLIKEIDDNYEELKLKLSELDANIKLTIENSEKDTIYTNSNALRFLEKYGLKVYVLDEEDTLYKKNLTILKNSISAGKVKNVFILENTDVSDDLQELAESKKINLETIRNLKNIKDDERSYDIDYIDITNDNLETLKKELY